MSTELEQVTLAVAAINKVETGLAALRETYGGVVYEVTTTDGMEAARVARRTIREPRFEVERIRKAAKAPILALGKQLDSEAARITRELTLLEAPIDQQITAEEDRKEKEKQARIDAEVARVAQIQRFLDGIREWPVSAAGKPSSLVSQMLHTALDYVITEEVFQERTKEAKSVLNASQAALQGIYRERLEYEAAQLKIEEDRQELARLKAEEAERQRVAAAANAESNRIERAAVEAERKRLADEQAETARKNEAERQRQAEEAGLITAAREALEKEQAALAEARKPKPEPALTSVRTIERPSAAQIVDAIAERWKVSRSMALHWLRHAQLHLEEVA